MTTDPLIRDALDAYASQKLILSWREVPGRGIVVIGAGMRETTLETPREAEAFTDALASAACAIHAGTALDGAAREDEGP